MPGSDGLPLGKAGRTLLSKGLVFACESSDGIYLGPIGSLFAIRFKCKINRSPARRPVSALPRPRRRAFNASACVGPCILRLWIG
jgi:hypothetical protein